ncbi:alpha/beta hydrolase [Lignipirellula cremea]|uniref:Non-heme chloroperoxidase n=1 Tax=Lignipirellula cremea TaxID=2528010 RepID=A0A518DT42_9BACT|nr:alpha/beta fold hydrolase [Lignipirellula cremea]QDU95012.1 Non-heme chloroperoxidase [Lignipirellula cremea]
MTARQTITTTGHKIAIAALAVSLLATTGCQAYLADMLAAAPNNGRWMVASASSIPPARVVLGVDQYFRVEVGPPTAELAVSVVEPHDQKNPPSATILMLHGLGASSFWMLDAAHELADVGYRVVLVDLRGHGGSTGDWLTYGPRESKDMSMVIDELEKRQLITGKLGVYGISFGAVTAIHLAAIDARVASVVAIAPFASIRGEAPHYFRLFFPGVGHLISDRTYQSSVDQAGALADFNPDEADSTKVLPYAMSPVLLLHGTNDWIVPTENTEKLSKASPWNTEVKLIEGAGHISIWYDSDRQVETAVKEWFGRHLLGDESTTTR